jgi:ABC-type lipoprotein release transport system permease subunit
VFLVLRLAWRNLWRQPKRTLLTTGAMVFSNVLLIFMISLQFGMYGLMIENGLKVFTGDLQVQAPGYKDDAKMRLTVTNVAGIAADVRAVDGLDAAARASAFALASSEDRTYGVAITGVEPDHEPEVSSLPGLVKEGRYLDAPDAPEIVIGRLLARNLKVGLDDELTLLGSGVDGSFAAAVVTVVGIFETGVPDIDRGMTAMPLEYFQDMFYLGDAGHMVVVTTPTLADVPAAMTTVAALLPADEDLVVLDWDTLEPGLKQSIQADLSSAIFMYFILVVLVAFSVLNTQTMSVLERTREFGIVMSLGLKPGRLARLVLLESALMGSIGVVAGALVGGLVTQYFSVYGLTYPGLEEMAAQFNLPGVMRPRVTLVSLFSGPLVVMLFSVIASLYPAMRLYRLAPVDAMRAT